MFGIKSRKRIKELEKELSEVKKIKNDLAYTNESLKQQNSKLASEMVYYRQDCHDLKQEVETLKSKLTRKKPIKKSEQ